MLTYPGITPVDYLIIGHILQDLTPEGTQIGGTAAYSGLTAAAQFQVHFRQELAVQKCAVKAARGVVDFKPFAKRVQACLGTGKPAAGEVHGVHRPVQGNQGFFKARQLRIEKADVELGVVDDEWVVTDEFEKTVGDVGKNRFVG